MHTLQVIDESAVAYAALSPLRLAILQALTEPASATELGEKLDLTRQKVNYHLGVLARYKLIEQVDSRQRRGFVERVFQRCGDVVLAPDLVSATLNERDSGAADAVIAAATDAIRAVGILAPAAAASGTSLATAALTTDVTFASPSDLRQFLQEVAELASKFSRAATDDGARRMRVTVLSHPLQEGHHND